MPLTDRQEIKTRLRREATQMFLRFGYSERGAREAQVEALRWLRAREAALAARRGLVEGWGVAFTRGGHAELIPVEVPRAGRGQVTVRTQVSCVSPGTERARYLRLPNARGSVLSRPGYSMSGTVVEVGRGVDHVRAGDVVAVTDAPHTSVVTVDSSSVFAVPPGVPAAAAALVKLGVIAGQGVRIAGVAPGEELCVIGVGPIGALAQRLAVAAGGACVAAVGRSSSKRAVALAGGARRFLRSDEEEAEIAQLAVPLVIEATGNPHAIPLAIRAAGTNGRIVLLGSPRGATPRLPVEEIRVRGLRVLGAHVDTVRGEARTSGADPHRRLADKFLSALADATVSVDDLLGPAADPREADLLYRRLAQDPNLVGAHFDWTRLAESEALGRVHLWRPPDVRGRGLEASRPLRPGANGRAPSALVLADDPFAGAVGRLRIGLLGCGDIARLNAAAVVAAPNAELTACFDPAPALAREIADRHGAQVTESAEELVEHPDVDAVFVCVPHHLHAPLAMQAAAAERHVIVEKPPAHTLAAALTMVSAAEQAGVTLTVCFPNRYDPRVVLARRLIDAGALGDLGGAEVRFFLDRSAGYWVGGYSGRSPSTWRSSRAQSGGGVLIMNLSHQLDLLRHLTQMDAVAVTASTATADRPAEVEDAISLSVTFSNGALASAVASSAVRGFNGSELRLWGRSGQVIVEPHGRVYTLSAVDGLRTGRWYPFDGLPAVNSRAVFVSRFASALHEGRPPDVTAQDGLAVQAITEAAYRSSADGTRVSPADLVAEDAR